MDFQYSVVYLDLTMIEGSKKLKFINQVAHWNRALWILGSLKVMGKLYAAVVKYSRQTDGASFFQRPINILLQNKYINQCMIILEQMLISYHCQPVGTWRCNGDMSSLS